MITRSLYNLLFYLALPVIFIRLLWRACRNPDYAKRWSERLGKVPENIPAGVIWWHSVSVGETLASIPLIKLLQIQYPETPFLITTMTPTGSAQVIQHFGQNNNIYHCYLPYDLSNIMSGFIQRIQPKILILMETELWPNLLYYTKKYQVPVLLANARLSEKSAKKYAHFSGITKKMLNHISIITAQYPSDAERFKQLGCPPEKIFITGSVKFDTTISPVILEKASILREKLISLWGVQKFIWIAASTHSGEEEIIIDAAKNIPDALLILVPRHPERAFAVQSLCKKAGFKTCLRSDNQLPDNDTRVFLINTLGELLLFYSLSDVAFVGGSLVPKRGHNLIEPASLGLPLLAGNFLYNFSDISKILVSHHALITVYDAQTLSQEITHLFQHPDKRQQMGNTAKNLIAKNKGATATLIRIIQSQLKH